MFYDIIFCGGVPFTFGDSLGCLANLRALLNYVTWFISAGYTFETRDLVVKLYRIYLFIFFVGEVGVIFAHLWLGVVDNMAFVFGALELMIATVTLALCGSTRKPGMLRVAVALGGMVLALDLCTSCYFLAIGHVYNLVKVDMYGKLVCYLVWSSLGFFAMDKELGRADSDLVFVWKLWAIEAIDFVTITFGAIKYAQTCRAEDPDWSRPDGTATLGHAPWPRRLLLDQSDGNDGGNQGSGGLEKWDGDDGFGINGANFYTWEHWDFTLCLYFVTFTVNALCFGGLSASILGSALTSDSHWIVGDGTYRSVAAFVTILDAITDLPVWIASLLSRSYVGNSFLTFNVLINLLALVRGVYVTMTAFLVDVEEDSLGSEERGEEHGGGEEEDEEGRTGAPEARDGDGPSSSSHITPKDKAAFQDGFWGEGGGGSRAGSSPKDKMSRSSSRDRLSSMAAGARDKMSRSLSRDRLSAGARKEEVELTAPSTMNPLLLRPQGQNGKDGRGGYGSLLPGSSDEAANETTAETEATPKVWQQQPDRSGSYGRKMKDLLPL